MRSAECWFGSTTASERSSSAALAWKVPARRPSISSARNWGSPRSASASSKTAPVQASRDRRGAEVRPDGFLTTSSDFWGRSQLSTRRSNEPPGNSDLVNTKRDAVMKTKYRQMPALAELVAVLLAAGLGPGARAGDDSPIQEIMEQVQVRNRAIGKGLRAPPRSKRPAARCWPRMPRPWSSSARTRARSRDQPENGRSHRKSGPESGRLRPGVGRVRQRHR